MFAGTMGAHVLNVLFQMFMGRYLRPEEFALMAALLGLFNVFATPLSVVGAAINRFSSLLIQAGREGDVVRLGTRWGLRLALIGLFCSAVCFVAPERVAGFLHFDRTKPVYIFGLVFVGIFCRPVVNGMLMGMQCYGVWCMGSLIGASIRLVVGLSLVLFVSPFAGWGLLGHGVGFYTAIVVGVWFVGMKTRSLPRTEQPLPRIERFLFWSFFVLFGYSILTTADVILVKNLYPDAAADFAYAATLARLVLFVPSAFVGSMFPKVVAEGRGTEKQMALLKRTLLLAFLSTGACAVAIVLLAGFLPGFIFNCPVVSGSLVLWMRVLACLMVPVAMCNVLLRFLLAQHQLAKAAVVLPAMAIYVGGAYLFSNDVLGVLISLGAAAVFLLPVLCVLVFSGVWKTGAVCRA